MLDRGTRHSGIAHCLQKVFNHVLFSFAAKIFLSIKRGTADRVLFRLLSKLPIVFAAVRRPQIPVKALPF
jgi:hypothetical protein